MSSGAYKRVSVLKSLEPETWNGVLDLHFILPLPRCAHHVVAAGAESRCEKSRAPDQIDRHRLERVYDIAILSDGEI